jgi:hypothetical protein
MIIREKTTLPADASFVKVVVDTERGILAMGCELHIDCADELESAGSSFGDLWGANLHPEEERIDYVSMINVRPQIGNRSMEIQDETIKEKVRKIIENLLF